MKTIILILSILIGFMICSCSSTKANKTSYKKIGKDELYIRGTIKCPSNNITYLNNNKNINLSFNKDICSVFKKEQDSLGNKVVWYMSWSKFENKFLPRSSLVNIYDGKKLKLERSMSFVTEPSFIKNQEKFKQSLYDRVSQIIPICSKRELDSISKITVLLTIRKYAVP